MAIPGAGRKFIGKIKFSFLLVFLALPSAQADDNAGTIPSISYDPFPYSPVRTHVWTDPGRAYSKKLDSQTPFPEDFPPSITIGFEDTRPHARPGSYFIAGRNLLRVYRITDIYKAPNRTIQPKIESLQKLLRDRPANPVQFSLGDDSRDYPPRNATLLIQSKAAYFDAGWGSGICYVTQFVQGLGEYPNNNSLVYLFQGLSKDGKFYVSIDFRVTHLLLKKIDDEMNRFPEGNEESTRVARAAALAATNKAESMLSRQPDNSFTPSLSEIKRWVSSLEIK